MSEQSVTVGHVLGVSAREMAKRLPDDLPIAELSAAAGLVVELVDGVELGGRVGRSLELLEEVLRIPIPDVLAAGWRSYEPFLKYTDEEAYPAGAESEVPLVDHTLHSAWSPTVDVLFEGVRVARLQFDVDLDLRFRGARLTIRDGRFMKLATGECEASGSVRLGDAMLVEQKAVPRALPGEIDFGEGILINPLDAVGERYAVPAGG